MIWLLGAALGALILFLSLTYICYLMAFSVPNKHFDPKKDLPTGEQYAPHNEDLKNWIADAEAIAFEEVYITAKDGTRLFGRYYLRLLTVSAVIAVPLGIALGNMIMNIIRVEANVISLTCEWIVSSLLIVTLITLLTIGEKIYRVSRTNPADVIKKE